MDAQKWDFERKLRSYLAGEWQLGGWWYYYLYGLAIKVPLGTWILVLLAIAVSLWRPCYNAGRQDELVLLAPALTVLVLASLQDGFSQHLRYVLPLFPFVFIWVSKLARSGPKRDCKLSALTGSALLWSMVSSMSIFPHSLSYFNELVGGPLHGHKHLVDSNIDWGQDLLFLKSWLDEHPEATPLELAYFGSFDPRAAGLQFTMPPPGTGMTREDAVVNDGRDGPQPGWFAISVNLLRGYYYPVHDGQGHQENVRAPYYTYFQHFKPVARAGYSIYIYHLSLQDCNRLRAACGQPLLLFSQGQRQKERRR
jgi:hypothetical protein